MKKLSLLILSFIGLLVVSCDKMGGDDPTYPEPDKTTAKEFLADFNSKNLQEFTINTTDLPKTITLKGNVKITIEQGTFTKGGVPVTGSVALEIREMLKPSTIIRSGTNTNYNGSMGAKYLETDGFIYINAKQNGQPLDERLSKNLKISIPTDKADGTLTQLWTGVEDEQFTWVDMDEKDMIWDEDRNQNQEFNTVWAQDGVFEFSFGKLGWCNCDVIWGEGREMTTVTVELTGNVGELASYLGYSGNTFVFFCGKGAPIVAQLYTPVNDTTVKSYDNSMPVGAQGKMIAFSIIDGKFSFAWKDITIEKDMKMTLDLKEVTKEALQKEIESLDGYSK